MISTALDIARAVVKREKEHGQPIDINTREALILSHYVLAHEECSTDPHDATPSTANSRQVAGEHYGLSNFQHWDMVVLFKLDYFQGQITKYVMRWRLKNGLTDLKKAAHFLEKYIETALKDGAE